MRFPWSKKESVTASADPVKPVTKGIGPEEAIMIVNSLDSIRSRLSQAISGGYDFADTLHNIFLDFGYPQTLTFENFWNMYRRLGIARNVVELPVDTTWMREPVVETEESRFEREFERLTYALPLWSRLKALDTRQRVGRYAGMFMRVRDGNAPDKPITKKLNGIRTLVQMVPLYEGQLEVLTIEDNPMMDNYGLPTMYRFNGGGVGRRNEKSASSFSIHPDRVIIAAEGADNGGIYGIPALEACYNSLMDLRKIIGGGGEGFYKNAAQNVIFDLKDATSALTNETLLNKFNEQYDEFARNRFRRALWTPGLEAKTLDSSLISPKDFFMNALNDVAASSKIAATILIGQQTGRLASDEDSRSFLSMINSRRVNFGTDIVNDVIDWLIKYGVLPAARYEVVWDDLLALSQNEQLDNADKMASINERQFNSGGSVPFEGEEIREAAGFEPREELPPEGEELPPDETDEV